MYYQNAVNKYKEVNLTTDNKAQQIIMLYEGAINFLKLAKKAIEDNDVQERYNKIQKTVDILNGMQLALDHENGGDVAKVLDDFYFSVITRLHLINVRNGGLEQLDHIIAELSDMLEAWRDVERQLSETKDTSGSGDDDNSKRIEVSI